jgi:peptide/nickel transport system ATP-binding protein
MTSMIDASSRAGILNLLEELRDIEGLSVLFITHDIGQAQYISDEVIVMEKGDIVEKGPVGAVLSNPQHRYTKELLSAVPTMHSRWDFLESLTTEKFKQKK